MFWPDLCSRFRKNAYQEGQTVTSEPGSYPPTAENEHRLLNLLTVATLNLALLRRHMDCHPEGLSAEMRETVERLGRAHRAMVAELRERPYDGGSTSPPS